MKRTWLALALRGPRAARDLASLARGLEALAERRTTHRIEPGRLLASEFNRAAEAVGSFLETCERDRGEAERRLVGMMHAQDELQTTLEEKVRERTAELHRAYEELKKIDSMKDSFISSVSHELRTPLSSIRSFSEILLGYDEDPQTRHEFLGIIKQESERLTRLINDVLDLAKMEAGAMVWQIEPISMAETCRRALGTVRVLAANRGQRLDLELPEDLPEVLADSDRTIQVLTNLLHNAVKFTPEGGRVLLRVDLQAGEAGDGTAPMMRVMVADDGAGIPAEHIGTIFEKFKQVGDTLTDKPRGTGLGLPISREIVRHLGGTMWVTSSAAGGSRFYFTLPLAGASAGAGAGRDAAGAVRGSAGDRRHPPPGREARVLIVDSDARARERLGAVLGTRGVEVRQAAAPSEAMDLCAAGPCDAIVLREAPSGVGAALRSLSQDPRTSEVPVLLLAGAGASRGPVPEGAAAILPAGADPGRLGDEVIGFVRDHRRWVAVADDDPGTVEVLSEMLRLRGYGVLSASDGDQALELARARDLDLMILDLNMPRKSGWKVLETLRTQERTRSLPVIVLTGMQTEMDRTRALALGAIEYLEKGHGLRRLASEIDLLVRRRRRQEPGRAAAGES